MYQPMFTNPFSQGDSLQQQLQLQLLQQQIVPSSNNTTIDKVSDVIKQLSPDEQILLAQCPDFIEARQMYDRVFIDFLAVKYKQEFMNTQNGSQSAQNLLDVTNNVIGQLKERNRLEREEIAKLSKILKDNPNILEQLENGRKD